MLRKLMLVNFILIVSLFYSATSAKGPYSDLKQHYPQICANFYAGVLAGGDIDYHLKEHDEAVQKSIKNPYIGKDFKDLMTIIEQWKDKNNKSKQTLNSKDLDKLGSEDMDKVLYKQVKLGLESKHINEALEYYRKSRKANNNSDLKDSLRGFIGTGLIAVPAYLITGDYFYAALVAAPTYLAIEYLSQKYIKNK